MKRIALLGLLLPLGLLPSADLFGQGKAQPEVTLLDTTPQDYQALAKMKGVYGRLLAVDTVNHTVSIRVEYQVPEVVDAGGIGPKPKPKANKGDDDRGKKFKDKIKNKKKNKKQETEIQRLAREYNEILRIKNPVQQKLRMQKFLARLQLSQQRELQQYLLQLQKQSIQFQQQLANLQPGVKNTNPNVRMVDVAKEFVLSYADNLRVARKNPPPRFNDKGDPIKYTDEELNKLKDDLLPGYTAKLEDVKTDQMVWVYFVKLDAKARETKATEAKAGETTDGEAKKQDEQPKPGDDKKGPPKIALPSEPPSQTGGPTVTGILIVSQPEVSFSIPPATPKKKKKN